MTGCGGFFTWGCCKSCPNMTRNGPESWRIQRQIWRYKPYISIWNANTNTKTHANANTNTSTLLQYLWTNSWHSCNRQQKPRWTKFVGIVRQLERSKSHICCQVVLLYAFDKTGLVLRPRPQGEHHFRGIEMSSDFPGEKQETWRIQILPFFFLVTWNRFCFEVIYL